MDEAVDDVSVAPHNADLKTADVLSAIQKISREDLMTLVVKQKQKLVDDG